MSDCFPIPVFCFFVLQNIYWYFYMIIFFANRNYNHSSKNIQLLDKISYEVHIGIRQKG